VNEAARQAARRPGLLGTMAEPAHHDYGRETARAIDRAIRERIGSARDTAARLLTPHKAERNEAAERLPAKEPCCATNRRPCARPRRRRL